MELHLRPMVVSDAESFASWAVDSVFRAHAGWTERPSVEESVAWWRALIARPEPQLIRLTAVSGDDVVGYVDLHGEGEETRELGFVTGPSGRWGQGWGTLAASAGLVYGFETLGLRRIWAEAVEANIASVRILQRLGMKYAGPGDEETFLGTPSTYARFDVSREQWAECREQEA